jgi:hypothetical protein
VAQDTDQSVLLYQSNPYFQNLFELNRSILGVLWRSDCKLGLSPLLRALVEKCHPGRHPTATMLRTLEIRGTLPIRFDVSMLREWPSE